MWLSKVKSWFSDSCDSFFIWLTFSILGSIIPFLLLVKWTSEPALSGVVRVFHDATLNGDIALVLLTLLGGLLGEIILREFYHKALSILAVLIEAALLFSLAGIVMLLKGAGPNDAELTVDITVTMCFLISIHALGVMAFSSKGN